MKIGFVDYYLDEWHANNYPAWLADASRESGIPCELAYAWAEAPSPKSGKTTEEWCREFGAAPCATLEELCEKSDVILVLAPSDPDKHLGYAETVLRYGKPTYIDKTFAPDLATAEKIFALADRYGAPLFSTSALRFATELDACPGCRRIMTTGGGRSLDEYVIHQIEMIVKKLGTGAAFVRAEAFEEGTFLHLFYPDDREAVMTYAPGLPFTVRMTDGAAKPVWVEAKSDYFRILLAGILRFFANPVLPFERAQTIEAMRIRDGALRAAAAPGSRIELAAVHVGGAQ